MCEILQSWLFKHLGHVFDMEAHPLGKNFQDGTRILQILQSYNIVNIQHVEPTIQSSDDPRICTNNLRQLCIWFKLLNISCSDQMVSEVAIGKGSTALRLLYELYLSLENKDRFHFISKTEGRGVVKTMDSRFTVEKVSKISDTDMVVERKNSLEFPLIEKQALISWYRKKHPQLTNSYKLRMMKDHKKSNTLNDTLCDNTAVKKNITKLSDMNDPIKQFTHLHPHTKKSYNEENNITIPDSSQILASIKARYRKTLANRSLKIKMQNILLSDLWTRLLKTQEDEFNHAFSKKLLKQSQYEKQLAEKLFVIQHQNRIVISNKLLGEKDACCLQDSHQYEYAREITNQSYAEENRRRVELHRVLYLEKLRQKAEKHFILCQAATSDLVDFAIEISEFKENNHGILPLESLNEWKELFFQAQPLFGGLDAVENLVYANNEKSENEEDTLVVIERNKQHFLNEHDLHDYLYLVGPWLLETWPELEEENVLGYIVHRLLRYKYPIPGIPPAADIQHSEVSAILSAVLDQKTLAKLTQLLTKQKIEIITPDAAINYCISTYHAEKKAVEIYEIEQERKKALQIVLDANLQSTQSIQKVEPNKKSKGSKDKSSKKSKTKSASGSQKSASGSRKSVSGSRKSKSGSRKSVSGSRKSVSTGSKSGGKGKKGGKKKNKEDIKAEEKSTPEDVVPTISKAGTAGQLAFETLTLGSTLPDLLLSNMLVELIRCKQSEGCNGWVVLNYPSELTHIVPLEMVLTGKQVPIDLETNTLMATVDPIKSDDPVLEEKRTSKLVPRRPKHNTNEIFKTYFTSFVCINNDSSNKAQLENSQPENEDLPLLTVQSFYTQQGIFKELISDVFDLATLKTMARLILKEDASVTLMHKTSVELFGDTVLAALSKLEPKKSGEKEDKVLPASPLKKSKGKDKKDEKVSKQSGSSKKSSTRKSISSRKSVSSKKSVTSRKSTKSRKSVTGEKKKTSKNEEQSNVMHKENVENIPPKAEGECDTALPAVAPEPQPGEDGWLYADSEQPSEILLAMATLWENLEFVYLDNLKELFFLQRVQHSYRLPYINYVTDIMHQYIQREDKKQEIVSEFQNMYNSIGEDLRPDSEMKCELHCRIFELQNLLWEMCDKKKDESEEKRVEIINNDWLSKAMCNLTNICVSQLQTEVDRCVDTLQLTYDYYFTMLGKSLPTQRLAKTSIAHFELEKLTPDDEAAVYMNSKHNLELNDNKLMYALETNIERNPLKCAVASLLIETEAERIGQNPFYTIIQNKAKKAQEQIDQLDLHFKRLKDDEEKKSKPKADKTANKKKKGKSSIKSEPLMTEHDKIIERLFKEWNSVVQTEITRVLFRLQLIEKCAHLNLSELQEEIQYVFHGFYFELTNRYYREIESVDKLCETFMIAIEEETRIQPELVLEDDAFYINPYVLLFPDRPPTPPSHLQELLDDQTFTVDNLLEIFYKLKCVAPVGSIGGKQFCCIIEDLLVCGTEGGNKLLFPKMWCLLNSSEIPTLLYKVFGSAVYVDWKHFFIYALDLPYPTVEDVLDVRAQFLGYDPDKLEVIALNDYKTVQLWFERELPNNPPDALHLVMAKEMLFHLFEVSNGYTNYTALILAFCKDRDPNVGFGKALSACLGKGIILSADAMHLEEKVIDIKMETHSVIDHVMVEVVNNVIQEVAGVIIKEIVEITEPKESSTPIVNSPVELPSKEYSTAESAENSLHRDKTSTGTEEVFNDDRPTYGDGDQPLHVGSLQAQDEITTEEQRPSIAWISLLPFGIVLKVLFLSFHKYATTEGLDLSYHTLHAKLLEAFEKSGVDNQIRAHILIEDEFIKTIFSNIRTYEIVNLSSVVTDILSSRIQNVTS